MRFILNVTLLTVVLWLSCDFVNGQWKIRPEELKRSSNPDHKCVMWGECHTIGLHRRACQYNGPPPQLFHEYLNYEQKAELLDLIERRCPTLLYNDEGERLSDEEIYTCCDYDQVLGIEEGARMAEGVLGRCPACLRNFLRQICEMNCSPKQYDFVNIDTIKLNDQDYYVEAVNFKMYEEFMLEAHESCAGVIVPQTGSPAIQLMCGSATNCDAEAWFGFSGNFSVNPFAPVQVNFHKSQDYENSMNVRALKCNETFSTDLSCSCVDCFANCPTGMEPYISDICTVLSVNCIGFSVGITFFVITVTIFTILTIVDYKKTRSNSDENYENYISRDNNKLVHFFEFIFSKIGVFCADNPVVIIMVTTWLGFAMVYGVLNINLTANPIELWSNPDSRTRQELDYFNSRFGPFYRTTQIYLQVTGLSNATIKYGPAFNFEAIKEAIALEQEIINIGNDSLPGVTLERVCTAPMLEHGQEPSMELCVIMSIGTYFGEDRYDINEETYLTRIQNCINNHLSLECMAKWGGGAAPNMVFGGLKGNDVLSADTLIITIPLANHLIQENLEPVLQWEQKFLDHMHNYVANRKPNWIKIAFAAERSIEDEIQRVSEAEVIPISISYVLMFIYVIFALGHIKSWKTLLVDSKISVAFGSIIIVLLAIFCAIGMMGYTGITTTLLAINVIPFFVLSVGIDNVFLMVNTLEEVNNNLTDYDEYKPNLPFKKKRRIVFQKMMEKAGPSIFVTSAIQITCFGIGTISNFPAVVTFAIFATFALTFLFILQITTIVAILSIDYARVSQNRIDVFCCLQKKKKTDENSNVNYKSITQRLIEPYSNIILNWKAKIVVVIIFMALVSISTILIPQIEIGLDQEMALPQDSYVYRFLRAVNHLLSVGPPVFFVLTPGLNFTDPSHQNTICGGRLCNVDSLSTQIFLASRHSNITFISQPSNSWLDDFFDWTTLTGSCCQFNIEDNSFCTSTDPSELCHFCSIDLDDNNIRPLEKAFQMYVPFFLRDPPSDQCNRGGLASYSDSVNYVLDSNGLATVEESNFMTFHTPLATSWDYIQAIKYAQEISANITYAIRNHTGLTDVEVFPYSVFYVFFEQYLTMWNDTFKSIGFSLLAAFLIMLILSGFNFITTFAVTFTVILVVINMMGLMYIWNIPLNAVSCVNLIVSIGIAVEFCNHTAYAFHTSKKPPRKKAKDALRRVGSTIITGITLTNIPIIVLAFSYTELIEVFFFRMLFGLVIIGFLHGVIFLPVLLSFISNITSYFQQDVETSYSPANES